MSKAKEISITLAEQQIVAGQELHGTVTLNYQGRFDSVVINSQIENSSDVFGYTYLNGKKINYPYARLSVFRADLGDRRNIDFIAITKHVPAGESSNVKFRATIIQEHKEVASDVTYLKVARTS